MTREELIKAIRSDSKIGRGTCSDHDECWTDDELWDDYGHHKNAKAALRDARKMEKIRRSYENDIRNA